MSWWKKLDNFDAQLAQLTIEELRVELPFWKNPVEELAQLSKKLTMKTIFKVQDVLDKKRRKQVG